jgi:F-type H+-transporting ATPase subunit b
MGPLGQAEFWVLIAFVIAGGVVVWKATPLLTGALDQRAARIKAELDAATQLKDEAERALAEYQRKQRDALKEAEQIIAHAKAEAERAAAAAERDTEAALERRRRMAADRIALEEAKALTEVRDAAIEIAIAAARRTLIETLDPARRDRLVDEAIAGLPQALA